MTTTVGIVGAGTMGGGIAEAAARAGCEVLLHDISAPALTQAMRKIADAFRPRTGGRGVEDQIGRAHV